MAIDTSKLTTYVNSNRDIVLKNVLFSAPSIQLMSKMLDVKGTVNLNGLDTTINFGSGDACGWSENATSTPSYRALETACIKINAPFCQRSLRKKWMQEELKIKAGLETLPQEEAFLNGMLTAVSEKMENMVYFGNKSTTAETQFDGIITIADREKANTASTINVVTAATGDTMYERIGKVVKAIPSKFYHRSIILCSTTTMRQAISDFESANPYKNLELTDDKLGFVFPNTSIVVKGVSGMDTTNASHKDDIIAVVPDLLVFGCDYEDASSAFKFIFNDHDDQFEYHQIFNAGLQTYYIDSWTYCPTV